MSISIPFIKKIFFLFRLHYYRLKAFRDASGTSSKEDIRVDRIEIDKSSSKEGELTNLLKHFKEP